MWLRGCLLTITYREYDHEKDFEAAVRLWKEVGWLARGEEERLGYFVDGSRGIVADLDGSVECLVLMTDGTMRYLDCALQLAACTGVTTGRVARRLGLARRTLARSLAAEARRGAAVSALGVFEHGFYDALGYGTGSYSVRGRFDPACIKIDTRPRPPVRLSSDDWLAMHMARLGRRRTHGSCNLLPAGITRMETSDAEKSFGMGYRDGSGDALTHYVWLHADDMEQGPYNAELVYRTDDQLRELLALIKSLSDQVLSVSVREPAGMMLQDWLDRPIRHLNATDEGKFEARIRACSWWQVRILDLEACIAATRWTGKPLRFNLVLHDPASHYESETGWGGIGGRYVLTLADRAECRHGEHPSLPTLEASVNAFSRMWLGVLPASGIAFTEHLRGPDELMARLDEGFRLPIPQPDWDF
jgi:predicted acetyltransferase